ncbi:right-handed parallel beta-helix repeat-containing protein [Paenibacillus antri]|uniref:Right-handed parallel beta-helix repeat-containing protein n=1 Tax=Paenibacillus antri TaxID=2582848 RepID=A0A5R9G8M4_9BACL|nr:right-handed parallel beta-helix repeat-containing protein [Paenibacillus antri]TLS49414.1 right-handed parallel beta-helix repeat-containing protein [Paenibacillus antri]
MEGKLKKLKNASNEYLLPITVAEAVYVEPTVNLKSRLSDIDTIINSMSGSATYMIDIERWGIVQGLPQKPYTEADYTSADRNIQGINNALAFARESGYNAVVIPRGEYSICYPRSIAMLSNLTFFLNGSTFKVMYDSDRKSPFDNRTTNDYFNFKGNSFVFENVTNAHLVGGRIIGDRTDRSWTNATEEAKMEHTYGVVIGRGSSHCSVSHCAISDYMGDNVSLVSSAFRSLVEFYQGLTVNGLDDKTGQPTTSQNTVITTNIPLPSDVEYSSILIAGAGYTRETNLNVREVDVYFYGENNAYLGVQKRRKIYTPITVPVGARTFRLLFRQEANANKYMQITIVYGDIAHHNVIEHNEIFNGHRGGITGGGSYNVIQHNVIRDNGKNTLKFLDGLPTFYDPTRYAINQEDSFGDNCVIRNNLIYNSNHGILVGCYSVQIENNHIYNVDSTAVNLYSLAHATIRGNFIFNCGSSIGLMTARIENAYVNITGNSIHNGVTILNGSGYQVSVTENNFVDPFIIETARGALYHFKNNYVKYSSAVGTSSVTVDRIEGCTFDSLYPQKEVNFRTLESVNSTFRNIMVNMRTRDELTVRDILVLEGCSFIQSTLNNHVYMTKGKEARVRRSKFEDSFISVGNTNTAGETPSIALDDCDITVRANNSLLIIESNRGYGSIRITDSRIAIHNPSFQHLLRIAAYPASAEVILKRNTLSFAGDGSLDLTYYSNASGVLRFVFADNRTTSNLIIPTVNDSRFVPYDPERKGVSEPSSGYFHLGDIYFNARPVPGSHVGWICTLAGYASNVAWTPGSIYSVGAEVHSNGKVYHSITSGTSGSMPPSHASGNWTDPNGLTWKYIGPRAVFRTFGPIST